MLSTQSQVRPALPGKRLLKALGVSMLVAISAMVLSAPAQAQQLLVESNGLEVNPATIEGDLGKGILLSDLANIFCEDGAYEKDIERSGSDLLVEGFAAFVECDVLGFVGPCDTRSPDRAVGSKVITAQGEGLILMSGSKTFALLESSEFTTIIVEGALCPLGEIEEPVWGRVTMTLDDPEKEEIGKLALLDNEQLFYGFAAANLEAVGGGPVLANALLASFSQWAIVLD